MPTILYAEDDSQVRNMFQRLLGRKGYEVIAFENGQEAWDYLSEGNLVDLLLTDHLMPRMNGDELLENFRSNPRYENTPAVLYTGGTITEEKAREAGADAFLIKPMPIPLFLKTIDDLLKATSLQETS